MSKKRQLAWKVDDDSGCWEVTSHKPGSNGYVHFSVNGKLIDAHRFMYESHAGPIPLGVFVMHKCDNKLCVNPAHLSIGTPKENTHDMVAKGRHKSTSSVGETNKNAKLTDEDVLFIRSHNDMRNAELCAMFGVTSSMISHIRTGNAWRHLPLGEPKGTRNAIGARNGSTKLNEEQVRFIKCHPELGQRKLSKMLGVSRATIYLIRTKKTWRHVADDD